MVGKQVQELKRRKKPVDDKANNAIKNKINSQIKAGNKENNENKENKEKEIEEDENYSIKCLLFTSTILSFIFVMLVTSILLLGLNYYNYPLEQFANDSLHQFNSYFHLHRVFTKEELAKYDGSDEKLPVYISIRGLVFDVTKGRKHYEKGKGYGIFAGRDATRSFATGCFDPAEDGKCLSDQSLDGLLKSELESIEKWAEFYLNSKDYSFVGVFPEASAANDEAKSYRKNQPLF